MQTLDVQVHTSSGGPGAKGINGPPGELLALLDGKKGAETARNGTSFLAIIQKMLAGSMEGLDGQSLSRAIRDAGRGAGDQLVPGEKDTLTKPGSVGLKALGSKTKENGDAVDVMAASVLANTSEQKPLQEELPEDTGLEVIQPLQQDADVTLTDSNGETSVLPSQPESMHVQPKQVSVQPESVSVQPDQVNVLQSSEQAPLVATPLQNVDPKKVDSNTDELKKDQDIGTKVEKTARQKRPASITLRDERVQQEVLREHIDSPVAETSVKDNGDGSADMSITFRTDGSRAPQGNTTTSLYTNPAADGERFSAFLAKEVKDGAQDFVRAGQIVLRNNNTGTIRLTLHPETLGSVRISLELGSDRKISGRIVVQSKEAYDAFSENLEGLSDAFRDGGFDTAGFNLSWSGKDHGEYTAEQQAAAVKAPFYAQSIPDVMSETETADRVVSAYRSDGSRAVNFFA